MENIIIKSHNNKENKAIYIVINYTSKFLHKNTELNNLHKNILANLNINIIMSKIMPIVFIIIGDKIINEFRIFNIKKFCYIRKCLFFQDINVDNYNFDISRDILFIKKQKEMIIINNEINKNRLKLKENINKFIYKCIYFNFRTEYKLFLRKIKKMESFNIEKNNNKKKVIALVENKNNKRGDDTKDETNSEMKNSILDKNLLKQLPPKISSLYGKKYKFKNDKIPNVFYNHLLITSDTINNKKRIVKCSLTRRIKGKSLTILFYSPLSKY